MADDVVQEVFEMTLVALFACCLDEVGEKGNSLDNRWKKKVIQRCCDSNPKSKSFLQPWLENDVQLTPEPLLKWFRSRDQEKVETRRRSNGVRNLVENVIKTGTYDARVRVALKQIAKDLNVSWAAHIAPFENFLASTLVSSSSSSPADVIAVNTNNNNGWSASRIIAVSAAAVLGGTAIALTAGAAAPFLAPVVGAIFATNAAASVALSVGLFGAAGAGLTGYKMADRTRRGLIEFFFEQINRGEPTTTTPPPSLHVVIGISGTMETDDVEMLKDYWYRALSFEIETKTEHGWSDVFTLVYDRKPLMEYSKSISNLLADQVVSYAYSYFLKQVVGHALMAAVSLPLTVVNASDMINNSFVSCERRSQDAGMELGAALRRGCQGARPVTLIGYGFGGLAIFFALELLAKEQAFGIVEDVVIIGTPLRASFARWENVRRIVAGKFINVYCPDDWTLKLVMEWSVSSFPVAGVEPINVRRINDHPIAVSHYRIGADGGKVMCKLLQEVLAE